MAIDLLLLHILIICTIASAAVEDENIYLRAEGANSPSRYIEYFDGRGLPLILAAPHGGQEEPSDIPDRDAGCWNSAVSSCVWRHNCGEKNRTKCRATNVTDGYTSDLAREVRQHLCQLFHGLCPGVVINLLNRTKLDANRALEEATFNQPTAVEAFNTFHSYIDREKERLEEVKGGEGRGLFIDIHGQNHVIERAEIGYLTRGVDLDSKNPIDPTNTSIKALAAWVKDRIPFEELLRGNASFGALLEAEGYRAVPSPSDRGPGGHVYFNGGYNTREHGSWKMGRVDGIQIESAHRPRMPPNRARYSRALSCAIGRFICIYYSEFINVTSLVTSSSSGDLESIQESIERENENEVENICNEISLKCGDSRLLSLTSFWQYIFIFAILNGKKILSIL